MIVFTRTLRPLLLTATLALHGCGGKDGGTDTSGSGSGDEGGGDDGASDDGGDDLPSEGTNPGECTDGADNDSDGLFDCNDPDCAGSPDCFETNTPGGCSDGADNDQDGLFDCDDPDCAGDEACGDSVEGNDAGECEDGIDNDGDGLTDCEDDDCAGFEGCDDYEGDEPGECTDGEDNDSDGLTDCDDDGCAGSPDCEEVEPPTATAYTYAYVSAPNSRYGDGTYDGSNGELNDTAESLGGVPCTGSETAPYVGWQNDDPEVRITPVDGSIESVRVTVGVNTSCGINEPIAIRVFHSVTGLQVGYAAPSIGTNTTDRVTVSLDSSYAEALDVVVTTPGNWVFLSEISINR